MQRQLKKRYLARSTFGDPPVVVERGTWVDFVRFAGDGRRAPLWHIPGHRGTFSIPGSAFESGNREGFADEAGLFRSTRRRRGTDRRRQPALTEEQELARRKRQAAKQHRDRIGRFG